MSEVNRASTGLQGLDQILNGLRLGDNVVWRVDAVDDYRAFVQPFVHAALAEGKRVVYCRFAQHQPLIAAGSGVVTYNLDAYRGFESFTTQLHAIIGQEGVGVFYLFDCLSELLDAWATDAMIGNFFVVTCPYLFELDTIAYFALLRDHHSFKTIARVRTTTQLLIDLYNHNGALYLHPLKVWERFSPTMFLPHRQEGDEFVPISNSYDATDLFVNLRHSGQEGTEGHLDHWHCLFIKAAELAARPAADEQQAMVDQLCRILIGREARMLGLARDYFTLDDLLQIKARLIGTGFIGGKAVGMLLARKMLSGDQTLAWQEILEPHDSWHIGSDLFYSYVIHNGWWRLLMEHKGSEGYFTAGGRLREHLLAGSFPDDTREEFRKMLEYFGQYPIIVRSSSLLEDSFGNAFAGKYDSFFCVNQGTPEQRCLQFEEAIRKIFASMMSEEALAYRLQRGLDQQDEQMALLVQRVSGAYHRHYFFPDLAGVGISYNTFVWHRELDPHAGMLRLVFGLGTRAVNRIEDDYPRLVALDRPLLLPKSDREELLRYSQHEVDLLNVTDNTWQTVPLRKLMEEALDIPMELFGSRVPAGSGGRNGKETWLLDFASLLGTTSFPGVMQEMLKTLEGCYRYPVDIEFTVNFARDGRMHINLVQCRPLQTKGIQEKRVEIPDPCPPEQTLFHSAGDFMGGSIARSIDRVILIDPEKYEQLPLTGKYDVARLVGRLNRLITSREDLAVMLLGPGRLGTSTPSLGVPVNFAEISRMAVLGEVAFSAGGLRPELSFGSHFFQDLVESDIFYVALFPDRAGCNFHPELLATLPNRLAELLPEYACYQTVVRVTDLPGRPLRLLADIVSQQVVCLYQ